MALLISEFINELEQEKKRQESKIRPCAVGKIY